MACNGLCFGKASGYFTLIGDEAPPVAYDRSEISRAILAWEMTGLGGVREVGLRIKGETMDTAAPYHKGLLTMRALLLLRHSAKSYIVLVPAAEITLGRLSRYHQGMVTFLGWLAHLGPQSRRRCIYWFCSSSQACPVCECRSTRSSHPPFRF